MPAGFLDAAGFAVVVVIVFGATGAAGGFGGGGFTNVGGCGAAGFVATTGAGGSVAVAAADSAGTAAIGAGGVIGGVTGAVERATGTGVSAAPGTLVGAVSAGGSVETALALIAAGFAAPALADPIRARIVSSPVTTPTAASIAKITPITFSDRGSR